VRKGEGAWSEERRGRLEHGKGRVPGVMKGEGAWSEAPEGQAGKARTSSSPGSRVVSSYTRVLSIVAGTGLGGGCHQTQCTHTQQRQHPQAGTAQEGDTGIQQGDRPRDWRKGIRRRGARVAPFLRHQAAAFPCLGSNQAPTLISSQVARRLPTTGGARGPRNASEGSRRVPRLSRIGEQRNS